MEEENYTPLTREQQHRLSKMNATKPLSTIKAEAEESDIANPKYIPSATAYKLDQRPKQNMLESLKAEILNDPDFKQRIIDEVAPLLAPQSDDDSGA